jgi:hypothetical protein
MANRNLHNSKKVTHLFGANYHEGSQKIAPRTPETQEEAVTASKSLQYFSHYEIGKI